MRPPNNNVRLVIQEVFEAGSIAPSYRVVVYPRRAFMREEPATFASRDELLARLREAIPDVDEKALAHAEGATHILFARELELSDEQLKILGLGP